MMAMTRPITGTALGTILLCLAATSIVCHSTRATASEAVHGEGVDPLTATAVQREQAQSRFMRGKQLYKKQEFAAALVEFEASRGIVASPNARLYRARCLRELSRYVEAYTEFGRTMVEALELAKLEVRYRRTAESATEERARLGAELAFVNVSVHNPRAETRLYVNGEEIRRTAWTEPVPAAPGEITLKLINQDDAPQVKRVSLRAGQSSDLTFDVDESRAAQLEPAPPAHEPGGEETVSLPALRTYTYVAAGVGAAGFVTFTVMGIMSNSTHSQLEADCRNGCPSDRDERISTGRTQQTLANVGLAVGVLGAAGAVTLYLLEPQHETEPQVALKLEPGWVGVAGRM